MPAGVIAVLNAKLKMIITLSCVVVCDASLSLNASPGSPAGWLSVVVRGVGGDASVMRSFRVPPSMDVE